jgi:hypothetical protein
LNWHPHGWLAASASAGLNLISRADEALEPQGLSPGIDSVGYLGAGHGTSSVRTLNLRATATAPLPLGFRLQAAVGANYAATSTRDLQASHTGLAPGIYTFTGTDINTSESQVDLTSVGWYVEPAINNSRLFLSTGLRLDGGNTYGTHVRLAGFPKVGVSYLISEERWFPPVLRPVFSSLRLRAAYGHAGVQPGIGDALRLYQRSSQWYDGTFVNVTQIQGLGNTQLKPERSTEVESGFDADLLSGRFSVSVTGYRKMRYDALMSVPVAPSVDGGASIERNIGTIRNTGLELTLATEFVHTDLLTWRTDLTVGRNQNRVVTLNGGTTVDLGNNQRVVAGYPLFGFWAKPILGYADANHDGLIEPREVLVGDSAVFMGSAEPNYSASLHTGVGLLRGVVSIDADLNYQNGLTQSNNASVNNQVFSRALNDPSAPFGEQAAAVGHTLYGLFQTVSTLRLTSFGIAYRLPAAVARRLGASAMSLALQGTNLGLWTDYHGKDPDVNANASGNAVADTGVLPVPRSWQLRVNVAY